VIRFEGEMDRTYQNTAATCVIEDPGLKRRIIVEKNHSQATVVWNPGETRAATFKDLGVGNWPSFVCVETANCVETAVTLAPGRTHEMTARISVAAL
jgi:glucose-6-phosphate 1-epimerase